MSSMHEAPTTSTTMKERSKQASGFPLFILCTWLFTCMCILHHMHAWCHGGQKRTSDLLELEILWTVLSCQGGAETQTQVCRQSSKCFNHRVISPATLLHPSQEHLYNDQKKKSQCLDLSDYKIIFLNWRGGSVLHSASIATQT